ncbi:U-box domain-containing protein 38-like, partial [Trifolium medium]|nr:U-box domain-containing protein 38-like [Trifolium medium]
MQCRVYGEFVEGNELESEATQENCVAALYASSHGSSRFKGLANEAKVVEVEVLRVIEESRR